MKVSERLGLGQPPAAATTAFPLEELEKNQHFSP